MSFYAQNNLIRIDRGGTNVWDTTLRMPHIVDFTSSPSWLIPEMPVSISGTQYTCNSSQNHYVRTGSYFTAANSFVFAYIRVKNNANRTEVDTLNPIFVAGTLCLRIYIEDNGYRGALLITPRAWDGLLGFNVEHTYNASRSSEPPHLYLNAAKTHSNPEISLEYSIYYGKYI
jgi:hypothetical protein